MSRKRVTVRAQRDIYSNRIRVAMFHLDENGFESRIAKPVVFEAADDDVVHEPALTLPIESAQQLMDELWNCGIRPTEGSGSAGSLAATERHLADMKKVAFGLLKKKGIDV